MKPKILVLTAAAIIFSISFLNFYFLSNSKKNIEFEAMEKLNLQLLALKNEKNRFEEAKNRLEGKIAMEIEKGGECKNEQETQQVKKRKRIII